MDGSELLQPSLQMPEELHEEGILVGWSLEHEHVRKPIGFSFGDPTKTPQSGYQDPILLKNDGHLMTIAPTGAGKGTGCIIPTLLRYTGPVIVVDPKGENYAITARARREMGQRVIVLDPMERADVPTDRLDPVDLINIHAADAVDTLGALVDLIATPRESDPRNLFWTRRGMQLVSGLLLYVLLHEPESKEPLHRVRYLCNSSVDDLKPVLDIIQQSSDPELRALFGALSIHAPETLGGYLAYAQHSLDFLKGESVREATTRSTFSLDAITRGDPISIYIIIPPAYLETHSQLLRIWIGALMTSITRRQRMPKKSTLFLLDEAAQLGPLPQLRQALTLLRGYGVRTWSFWQDLSQLRNLYPYDWQTMVNNCKVLQAFGVPNMVAANEIANLTGFPRPERLLDMDWDEMVLLLTGDEAVIAQRPHYLSDAPFRGAFDHNPFYDDTIEIMPRSFRPRTCYERPKSPTKPKMTVDSMPEPSAAIIERYLRSRDSAEKEEKS